MIPNVVAVRPDLEHWIPNPAVCIVHSRESSASADQLWAAARAVRVSDAGLLGRLIRWRIPGTPPQLSFDELFRCPPFAVLDGDQAHALVSGLVGRIWTIRRDYPSLSTPEEFRTWREPGTARVLFANWVSRGDGDRARLTSEARVDANGRQGRIGLAAVRPLVASFHGLIASDGIAAAVRLAEARSMSQAVAPEG
jgi:hypothetical protein